MFRAVCTGILHGVAFACLSIHAHMRLHPDVPTVALAHLMHLRVALAR